MTADALVCRSHAYGMLGDHQAAVRDLERAVALDPTNAESAWYLESLGVHAAAPWVMTSRAQAAEESAKKAVKGGLYAEATRFYTIALESGGYAEGFEDEERCLAGRARAYLQMKTHADALLAFKDANYMVEVRPAAVHGYLCRAAAYMQIGGAALKAQKDLEQARRIDPYNEMAREMLYELTVDWDLKQERALQERVQRTMITAEHAMATISTTGNWAEALVYINEVLHFFPNDKSVNHEIDAVIDKTDQAKWFCLRSGCHLNMGRLEEAKDDATIAVNKAPHTTEGYIRRAEAFEAMGDWDRARHDYALAMKVQPEIQHVVVHLMEQLDLKVLSQTEL
jgi:tetratricopeptide (TPR) repeat protein